MTNKLWVLCAAIGAATTATAGPPECKRWDNGISCADVGTTCATEAQLRYYYAKLYTKGPADQETAQIACDKWAATYANPPAVTAEETGDPEIYGCYIVGQTAPSHTVSYVTVNPEPMCFRKLRRDNPYAGARSTSYTYGAEFASFVKAQILKLNTVRNGQLMSDYAADPYHVLVSGGFNVGNSANVDHIIPRVDIKGCECGTNDPANAIVISRELNIRMSNFSNDPDRLQILELFTTW